jgi:DNA-binding CsgD family transcriptional regulator
MTATAETAPAVTAPRKNPGGRFAFLRRTPGLEIARPSWAKPFDRAAGLQFYVRRGVGHGLIDKADGLPELTERRLTVLRTIAYAEWLDGATVEEIAAKFGWKVHTVYVQLRKAKARMSTLAVVHEAIGKLDRLGVPAAVDTILKSIHEGNVDAAFKLLAGRHILAKPNAEEGPRGGADGGASPSVFAGVQVNIVHSDGSKVTLGTVVGQPLAGAVDALPIDGEIVP